MRRLLHVIADYAPMSQEFGEILQRIWTQNWDLDLTVLPVSVPSMDTIGTGYLVHQLALGPNPPGTVLYVNCAPRKERTSAMTDNAGEKLVWCRVETEPAGGSRPAGGSAPGLAAPGATELAAPGAPGEAASPQPGDTGTVEVVAVNSGYSLSLLKGRIVEMRALEVPDSGSQFRSRDFFPPVVADVLHGAYEARLRERLDPASIPAFPESVVMWTDGFGNIKTSIRRSVSQSRWREGQKVHIDIGGRRATALVTGGVFSVDEGELAWSVGSSGHDDPFMEIFLRGASASDLYGNPRAGEPITLRE